MSMHYEGYDEFGMLIPFEYTSYFYDRYSKANPENAIFDSTDIEHYEAFHGCQQDFNASFLGSDCEGLCILPINGDSWRREKCGLLIFAEKATAASLIFKNGFYKTKKEIVDEMIRKTGDYLPKDFDYEAHIGDVSWALFA